MAIQPQGWEDALASIAIQIAGTKTQALKDTENAFFEVCFSIYGDYTKRGFDELSVTLEEMLVDDPMRAITLNLRLLSLDAIAKRYDARWWDTAARTVED